MSATSKKLQKGRYRQRLAAISFLANISLDGTYNDTKYSAFNRKHQRLKDDSPCNSKDAIESESIKEESFGTVPNEPKSSSLLTVFNKYDSSPVLQRTSTISSGEKGSKFSQLQKTEASTSGSISLPLAKGNVAEEDKKSFQQSSSLSSSSDSFKEVHFLKPDKHSWFQNGRVLIVSKAKVPLVICSVLGFCHRPVVEETRQRRHSGHSGSRSISSQEGLLCIGLHALNKVEDGQDVSYKEFLVPSRAVKRTYSDSASCVSGETSFFQTQAFKRYFFCKGIRKKDSHSNGNEEMVDFYDPNLLDDPELQSGSYRTLMTFSSYITSVIDYVKPSSLKKELNEKFKERFPNIQLTLSKLRSIKKELWQIAVKSRAGIWTVAQAYVFFEKLILKHQINKQNRKLCAGACLMLSAKLNDVKGADLSKLIEQIEDTFRLHRKEMLSFEFACLVTLEFSLHIPDADVYPHYQRLVYRS